VKDLAQLNDNYRKIVWDTGDLETGLGNGSGTPEKTNDYQLMDDFLANLSQNGGLFVCGDDALDVLNTYQTSGHPNGVGAITFKSTYLPYNLTTANAKPVYGISPTGTAVAGGMFTSDTSMIIYGGCPLINDFDVAEPQGTTQNHMTYGAGTATSTNGAVIANINGNAHVAYAGFSFGYIRDNDNNGVMDRADFMHDMLTWMGNTPNQPTPAGSAKVNSLSQNYPNPFNPQTTIAFSVKDRGLVTLKVYNVAGELVRTLANEDFTAGAHTKVWDGRNDAGQPVSSGVYFYKLVSNNFTQTKKMVLLK
jgi:FlgD Ig-like domain